MSGAICPVLTLPWPPAALSPNARVHWRVRHKAGKAYRAAVQWTAYGQGARMLPRSTTGLTLSLVFVPPSRRAYDLDNALARMKAGLDGLSSLLGVDDSRWDLRIRKAPPGEIGGFVRVEIFDTSAGSCEENPEFFTRKATE